MQRSKARDENRPLNIKLRGGNAALLCRALLLLSLISGYCISLCAQTTGSPVTAFSPAVREDSAVSDKAALPDAPQVSSIPAQSQSSAEKAKQSSTNYSTPESGSPGHIFWIVPAYKVDYQHGFTPMTPDEKFWEWAQSSYDPLGLSLGAIEAGTLQYSSKDGFCGYGHGWGGYGKCYGSMKLDSTVSSFIGDYALTVLLHQDPRYFRLGSGSFGKRAFYAISRVFVTYSDTGKPTFYSSALTGTVAAAAISNLYYPQSERGLSPTISRIGIDLGNTALYNGAAEFWPDIHRKFKEIFRTANARTPF